MSIKTEYNYKTLSMEDIEEICKREIREYNFCNISDYPNFVNTYIKASAVADENRFTFIKKDNAMSGLLQQLQLDRAIVPDPLFKAKMNEFISELMNRHFTGNKLGEFTISDEIYGQQKLIVMKDENNKSSLRRINPSIIADIIANFLTSLNDNVFSLMVGEINFNVWYNAVKSLVCYSNSAIYLDTGINYEYFIPYNIELTDIVWMQNEKNIIDRVFCKKKFKFYQLQSNFNTQEIDLIKQCYLKNDYDKEIIENKIIELLHIVCPNTIPQEERKQFSITGKDKDFLSLIVCKDVNSKDKDFSYKIIRVGGYDKMPYLITRINRKSVLSNYGYPLVLEAGESAIANSLLQSDINDIAKIKTKPPLLQIPGFIEGGNLNLNRRAINRARIDDGKPLPSQPVNVLQTIENDAIHSAQIAIQMNTMIQDEVFLRTERNQITRHAGAINNYVSQLLDNAAIVKMSPISSSIEAELKKPLLEFIANYFILNEFTRLTQESKQELNFLKIQLNQQKDTLDDNLGLLRQDLNIEKGFENAIELRFKEKLWTALTGKSCELLTQWNSVDNQNAMEVALKLNYFWDVIFNYDNEELSYINRFNIKSIKNIDLKLIPLREEVALMQDVNLKIQAVGSLMQIAQIDPESAKVRVDIDQAFSDMRKIPMMRKIIRDDQTSMLLRQQMAQQRQQQAEMQAQQQQQNSQQEQQGGNTQN